MMTSDEMWQAAVDFWRCRDYGLKEYVIRDGKKHPFALVCPGGAYEMICSFLEGLPYAKRLNKLGYSAFVLYYRCQKKACFPAPWDDIARVLRDFLSRGTCRGLLWNGEHGLGPLWPSQAGDAGAHLSRGNHGRNDPCWKPEKSAEHPSKEQIALTRVEKQVTANYPPTFVWCGDADKVVAPENSRMLARELERCGVPHEFVEYPGVDHGVGLGKGLACEGWFDEAVAFWNAQTEKL